MADVSGPFQTDLTRALGIEAPILQAPMNWATDARLVAAVSNAGGLGCLGPNAGIVEPITDPAAVGERLRQEIRAVRALTGRPFAVNMPVGPGRLRVYSDVCAGVVAEERVPVAIGATGSPEVYTVQLKAAGCLVLHAVASVRHALKAQAAGVDAVVAQGFDAGGHTGFDETPTSTLVPQCVDALDIPVVAAGGIVDGRGLVAAFAAGAQAVYMGTRFMAAVESPVHARTKDAIVDAHDAATVSWGRRIEVARTLDNAFTRRVREMEAQGAEPKAVHAMINAYAGGANRRLGGLLLGDIEEGEISLGSGAGMIDAVLPAREIIARTLDGACEIVARLSRAATARASC